MMKVDITILTEKEINRIHDYTLKVLQDPGMRIMNKDMLDALEKKYRNESETEPEQTEDGE